MNNKDKFIIARWSYAIGADFISDTEYDHLEEEIKSLGILQDYTSRGWSEDPCPVELLKKYNLEEWIKKSTYTYSTESIESLNSIDLVKERLGLLNEESRLSYKLDGYSLRLNYYNGDLILVETRNRNGGKSMDLSNIESLFKQKIKMKGKVLITGELYIKNKTFNKYKSLRGVISQRNSVSTAIANGDVEYLDYRVYNIYSEDLDKYGADKYKILEDLGFSTPKNVIVRDYKSLIRGIQILGMQKKMYSAPTDGCVLENSTIQYALRVGEWEESCNSSYVTGYKLNRGMYDNSVLVSIKPLFINGKTVSEIPVTNLQYVIDNNLRIGYPIAFVERSSVNSVLDTTKTEELQRIYEGNYDKYREEIDNIE